MKTDYIPAVAQFRALHGQRKGDGLRMGQRFVNLYMKTDQDAPGLYELDGEQALWKIRDWLEAHHYSNSLPPEVKHD